MNCNKTNWIFKFAQLPFLQMASCVSTKIESRINFVAMLIEILNC
jgi:hypothetical protein